MAKVQSSIIQKRAALTHNEFKEIKNHINYSYQMVQHIPSLKEGAKVAIFQHHERLDGSGYPMGIKSNKIHPIAQIIAVADTYHAMTSERMYRKKQSPFRVLELMRQDQFGQFDISALNAFVQKLLISQKVAKLNFPMVNWGSIIHYRKIAYKTFNKTGSYGRDLNLEKFRELYVEEII